MSSGLLPPLPPFQGGITSSDIGPTLATGDGIKASGSAGPLASLLFLPDTTKQRKVTNHPKEVARPNATVRI